MAFIQGYLFSASVNGTQLNLWSSSGSLAKTTNAIAKPILGKLNREYVNGKKDTTMTVAMHLDTASLILLQAADDASVPVVCSFRPGEVGNKDAGQYDGDGIITELNISGGAEDNWSVDLSVQGTGPWPYTDPA